MTTASRPSASRRLLFLSPFPPALDAIHGGARVLAQLMSALSTRHDVSALYLRAEGEAPMDDRLRQRLTSAESVRIPSVPSIATRIARRTASLRGVPAWASFVQVPEFTTRLRAVASSTRPDVVHFEYHVMGQYAGALPDHSALRVLSEYEAGVLAAREHMATGQDGNVVGAELQQRAWERFEQRVIAEMDGVVVFSERDREALTPLANGKPIIRIGIGTNFPDTALDPLGSASVPSIVFVGNFKHPPNVDAAVRLARAVFPVVRARVPSAELKIVGADPPDVVEQCAGNGVQITGRVPDVVPWLDSASVVVAPLRLGGGMRVKVLEAFAHGKAVVATRLALEGLYVIDGVHAAIADSDADIAARIVELIEDPEKRGTMARRAREWARTNLGEARWVAEYEALYDSLAAARMRA